MPVEPNLDVVKKSEQILLPLGASAKPVSKYTECGMLYAGMPILA